MKKTVRKSISALLAAAVALTCLTALCLTSFAFGGSGSIDSPYVIADAADLAALASQVNGGSNFDGKYFRLAEDITLSGAWTPIGTPEHPFSGFFDGNNKTVDGLSINEPTKDYRGLFGYINGGQVQNLTVNGSVDGKDNVGAVAGYSNKTVSNCTSNATVYGINNVGGIVGYADFTSASCYCLVVRCVNNGYVRGYSAVGGIVGSSRSAGISKSANTGSVLGNKYVGGIAGYSLLENSIYTNTVDNCYNLGKIINNAEDDGVAAGITCGNPGKIYNCYNAGTIDARVAAYAIASDTGLSVSETYNYGKCISEGSTCFTGGNCTKKKCFCLADTVNELNGAEEKSAEQFRTLDSALGSAYENNGTVNRPILTVNKEVETNYIHVLTHHEAVPSTCKAPGRREYYSCSCACKGYYADPEGKIPLKILDLETAQHEYEETENEDGSTTYTCKNCGDTKTFYVISAAGDGTQANPYEITTPEMLLNMQKNVRNDFTSYEGEYIVLKCDVDLSAEKSRWSGIGDSTTPFKGNFNGEGHKIKFGTVNIYTGFFGYIEDAVISDLFIEGGTVKSTSLCAGGVVCHAENSTIKNCASQISFKSIYGSMNGGIVGYAKGCTIESCIYGGNFTIPNRDGTFGGIAGNAINCVIRNCIFAGMPSKLSGFDVICLQNGGNLVENCGYIDFMKGKISDDENVFQCEKIDTSNASEFLAENGGLVYMTCDESVHEDCFGAIALSSNPEQAAAHIDSADRSFDVTASVFGGGNALMMIICAVVIAAAMAVTAIVVKKKKKAN